MAEQPPAALDPGVLSYYDRAPEESRLEHGAFRLEAVRTRELIARHVPGPGSTVFDIGGAAGAYAFWLADQGYDVHLVDAVPRLVDEARRRNGNAPSKLASVQVADAGDLPLGEDSAEVVLLLGPLYHLVEARDRQRALREAERVLKPGGVLIAAAISRFASLLDGLRRERFGDPQFARLVEHDLADGQHRNPTESLDYFTTAYFHRPEDLRAEVDEAGFDVEHLYGIEGPGWMLPDLDERWEETDRREAVLRVARSVEEQDSVVGTSAHLLVVARNVRS